MTCVVSSANDVNFSALCCVVQKGAMSIQKCLLDNSSRMIKAMSNAKSGNEVKTVSDGSLIVYLRT